MAKRDGSPPADGQNRDANNQGRGQVQSVENSGQGIQDLRPAGNQNHRDRQPRGQRRQPTNNNQQRGYRARGDRGDSGNGRNMNNFFTKKGGYQPGYNQQHHRVPSSAGSPGIQSNSRFGGVQDIRLIEDPDLPRHVFHTKPQETATNKGGVQDFKGGDETRKRGENAKEGLPQGETPTGEESTKLSDSREYEENVGLFCGPPGTGVLFKVDKYVLKEHSTWFSEQIGDKDFISFELKEGATLVSLMLQYMHLGKFNEFMAEIPAMGKELSECALREGVAAEGKRGPSYADECSVTGLKEVSKRLKSLIDMSDEFGMPKLRKLAATKLKGHVELSKKYLEIVKSKLGGFQEEMELIGGDIEAVEAAF
ncbi:hypothetical protein DRE_07338 [Drechslerella stenobrocha 248]|uniref:BTB domain-containing protein n=1 Tax=Drechslerella stenobrocha 248 TaxID=1043628 RepID=W7HV68_9PEZI|nr:hypothetical protein DRE_07338 [Drechslerella stenobrocha 248]